MAGDRSSEAAGPRPGHSASASGSGPAADTPEARALLASVRELLAAWRGWLAGLLELATLELRHSGALLAAALALAVLAAVALITAWALAMAALAAALVAGLGWSWGLALLALAGSNLVLAGLCAWLILRLLRGVGLGRSRAVLNLGPEAMDDAAATPPAG